MTKKLRLGVVPYMNAKPLIYGLNQQTDSIELSFEVPSLLPNMLNNDQIDVAIIPSIEYFRSGNYAIIPDISISSCGAVDSVKFLNLLCAYPDTFQGTLSPFASLYTMEHAMRYFQYRYRCSPHHRR
jgi:hypothetical protein